jgi:hypothetical protein
VRSNTACSRRRRVVTSAAADAWPLDRSVSPATALTRRARCGRFFVSIGFERRRAQVRWHPEICAVTILDLRRETLQLCSGRDRRLHPPPRAATADMCRAGAADRRRAGTSGDRQVSASTQNQAPERHSLPVRGGAWPPARLDERHRPRAAASPPPGCAVPRRAVVASIAAARPGTRRLPGICNG